MSKLVFFTKATRKKTPNRFFIFILVGVLQRRLTVDSWVRVMVGGRQSTWLWKEDLWGRAFTSLSVPKQS